MGGYGSGRKTWRGKIEDYVPLNINEINQRGYLIKGKQTSCVWSWSNGNALSLYCNMFSVTIDYTFNHYGGAKTKVKQEVRLEWTPCNHSNSRPWFRCPKCGRRCAKLRGVVKFYCSKCHNLAYSSQSESQAYRLLRKRDKLLTRLGNDYYQHPKGMRHITYQQLLQAISEAETQADMAFPV